MKTKTILLGAALTVLTSAATANPLDISLVRIDLNAGIDLAVTQVGDGLAFDFSEKEDNVRVQNTEGSFFSALPLNTVGTWYDNTINPGPTDLLIWEVGGYKFELNFASKVEWEPTIIQGFADDTINDSYRVVGLGRVTYEGEELIGGIAFDGNTLGNASQYFDFSSTTGSVAIDVPEPGALALLALGLIGLGISRKKAMIG